MFAYRNFAIEFIYHILISLNSFVGTPDSVTILYNTSLLIES
jgi:hypothetical protein